MFGVSVTYSQSFWQFNSVCFAVKVFSVLAKRHS